MLMISWTITKVVLRAGRVGDLDRAVAMLRLVKQRMHNSVVVKENAVAIDMFWVLHVTHLCWESIFLHALTSSMAVYLYEI
ncbi:hypothetical protein BD311DRAFT_745036 [Dichomitus squalens]|uniref:Uncharacterized protein n=1 Tax=Dichomitus squalens TaxID=114155 RepID=A0A4Q9N2S3_9APHY|nr:hypothetical protein BD311DRAFT_745036 [Dichomitus squalens]